MGMTETNTVGMAESDAKNMAEMGAIGAVREVAVSISMFAATPGSLKVSRIRGVDMQNKGRPQQRGDTIYMYK